jgi:isocitrate dehydrogenase (NAD+)
VLHHLDEEAAANKVEKALEAIYAERNCLTRDVGAACGTPQFADAVLKRPWNPPEREPGG